MPSIRTPPAWSWNTVTAAWLPLTRFRRKWGCRPYVSAVKAGLADLQQAARVCTPDAESNLEGRLRGTPEHRLMDRVFLTRIQHAKHDRYTLSVLQSLRISIPCNIALQERISARWSDDRRADVLLIIDDTLTKLNYAHCYWTRSLYVWNWDIKSGSITYMISCNQITGFLLKLEQGFWVGSIYMWAKIHHAHPCKKPLFPSVCLRCGTVVL